MKKIFNYSGVQFREIKADKLNIFKKENKNLAHYYLSI
jgi:hypothetical protein